MGVDFNVNEEVNKNKSSRYFIGAIIVVILIVLIILALNGKHNKLPGGVETNIPSDTLQGKARDTNRPVDNSKKIEIKDNHGVIPINM